MQEEKLIIDGENAVLGRLASFSAKQALMGKRIIIINSEKVIISGNKKNILENYLQKRKFTNVKFPSLPERILKRTIRGMLSHKQERGRTALKRVICYKGVPKEFEKEKKIKSGRGKIGVSLEEISRLLK